MDYQEILKSIQAEIKPKINFKKELKTVQLIEEYVDAYEQYLHEVSNTKTSVINDSPTHVKEENISIPEEDISFHSKIKSFIDEVIDKGLKRGMDDDLKSRTIAGIAHSVLGKCFLNGIFGCMKNLETAVENFAKSVIFKNPTGTFELARCFELGIGTERDTEKACMLYRVSYKLGYIKGLHRYGILLIKGNSYIRKSILDGYYMLKQATQLKERVYILQYYDLGMLFKSGACDIFNDPQYAFQIFSAGASKGCRYCQYKLGEEWQVGEIVEKNLEKAFHWYRISAKNNLSDAQLKVAKILYGIETASNIQNDVNKKLEAISEGQVDLNDIFKFNKRYRMTELEIAVMKQRQLLNFQQIYGPNFNRLNEGFRMAYLSAKNGNLGAILLVAEAYEKGYGVEKNILSSIWWYRIAETLGADNIREKMHLLELRLGKKIL